MTTTKAFFTSVLKDLGIPTTEEDLENSFKVELEAQGSKIGNQSVFSPFFKLVAAIVTKPFLWILDEIINVFLPNMFLKYAWGNYLEDMHADPVGLKRSAQSKAKGKLTFTRSNTSGDLPIPAGTVVESVEIDSVVYRMITTIEATILDGQVSVEVQSEAENPGAAYNLGDGYYSVLQNPVPGIDQVSNDTGWLTSPGTDAEADDDLRDRCRSRWSEQTGWHTDDAYRSIITSFKPEIAPDDIFFDHTAPRGPFTADAYILLEVGEPSQTFLDEINDHINLDGYHGHNDDLLCFAMPTVVQDFEVEATGVDNLSQTEKDQLAIDIENVIRAAFRENANYPKVTRSKALDTFSLSNLVKELHNELDDLHSISFIQPTQDPVTAMEVVEIGTLSVSVT